MPRRHRSTVALITTGAALLSAVPAASAAVPVPRLLPRDIDAAPRAGAVEFGTAEIKLSGGAAGRARSAGVKLSGTGTAKVKGRAVAFDAMADGGWIDPTIMQGSMATDGGLSIRGRKGTASLKLVTFVPGSDKEVTAKIGKKTVTLGTLTGGRSTFSKQSDGALKGARLSLSSAGAKAINAKTGGGFAKGAFGTVDLEVTTRELPIKQGTAKMTLSPEMIKMTTDAGLVITATPPAVREGDTFTINLTAGAFDPEGLTGRLSLEGEVVIGRPDRNIRLFGWRGAVSKRQSELFVNINESVAAPAADIDVSALNSTFEGSNFVATGAKLKISKIASQILKQQFGADVPVGTPMGTVDMTGQLNGS